MKITAKQPSPKGSGSKIGKAMDARLPEDLIVEILVKLPVKSLLRFRCVCKSWYHLVKSPDFINLHFKHHSTKNGNMLVICGLRDLTTSLMSFHSYESLGSFSSPHMLIPHFKGISIEYFFPCNGLLCISDGKTIVLCNPATREFKVLPGPFVCPDGWEFRVRAIGFGFDSNTNDYKVVAFVRYPSHGNNSFYKTEIYTLSSNSWRGIDHDIEMPSIVYSPGYGMLFNGGFHWIVKSENNHSCILSLDMSTEVFQSLELPLIERREKRIKRLTTLNESFALFAYTPQAWRGPHQLSVDIWVMREYGVAESWVKQFTVGPLSGILCPYLLWKNEAIILESRDGRLMSCALDTDEVNYFNVYGFWQILRVMVYQESLFSIN